MLKIGITMNEELASRMDEYAADNYMSRSGVISLAVSQFLNAKEVSKCLKELTEVMKEIAAKCHRFQRFQISITTRKSMKRW